MEIREVGDESCQNVYYTCVQNCQTINLTILLAKNSKISKILKRKNGDFFPLKHCLVKKVNND